MFYICRKLEWRQNYPNFRLGLRFCGAMEFFNNLVNKYVFFKWIPTTDLLINPQDWFRGSSVIVNTVSRQDILMYKIIYLATLKASSVHQVVPVLGIVSPTKIINI